MRNPFCFCNFVLPALVVALFAIFSSTSNPWLMVILCLIVGIGIPASFCAMLDKEARQSGAVRAFLCCYLLFAAPMVAGTISNMMDCGEHGSWSILSCSCEDEYSGYRCRLPPLPAGMAEGYTISGAPKSKWNGLYELAGECNDKPAYQYGECVLFQPVDSSSWMVGSYSRLWDCESAGSLSSHGNGGWCSASPDGDGCAGLWQAYTDDCGEWCDAPSLTVTAWCSEENPCCAVDCGAHGTFDVGDACSCGCMDGYSGDRCQLPPLPAGMAANYTISGARRTYLNGAYVLAGECNGKPAYQLVAGGYVLFQPTFQAFWMVWTDVGLARCGP